MVAGVAWVLLLATLAPVQALTFHDATEEAGVAFRLAGEVHDGESLRWPGFPEIMGSGACWLDVDGDGYDDLYLVNQVYNAVNPAVDPAWVAEADPHNQLYRNEGDGTFTDMSAFAGVDSRAWGYACSAADYDGDGHVDLFVANFGDNELFRNLGDGTFTNVTSQAGVAMPGGCGEFLCMSTSSAWADYDADGDLDLYVGNYVDTVPDDMARGPINHIGQHNFLHRNEGDGTFTEVAAQTGVQGQATDAQGSKSLGVVWFDADLDGDLDLYVANDEVPNDYYLNLGDGTFEERSDAANLANPFAGMGVASGDYDLDGLPDLFFTHYEAEENGFFRNLGDGTFEDRSGEDDLHTSFEHVGWSTAFVDWDRDMDLDLMLVNGHTEWDLPHARMPAQAFRNDPGPDPVGQPWDRTWVEVSEDLGAALVEPHQARGAAWADYDHDGDTDLVVVSNGNETARLLRADRDGTLASDAHHWLSLQLRQSGMNRHAVGARVGVDVDGVVQWREVQAGSGYLGQDTLELEFGLGPHTQADKVTVHWPSGGGTTVVADVPAGHVVRIHPDGSLALDTLSPVTAVHLDGMPGGGGWWRSPPLAAFTADDRGVGTVSGVDSTSWSLDHGPWHRWQGEPFAIGEGRHVLRARSLDHAGNLAPPSRMEVNVDATPPVVAHRLDGTQGMEGWFVSDAVTVTLEASDAGSGVMVVRYRLDDGPWRAYHGPFEVTGDGTHTLTYHAVDVAGNVAADAEVEVRIDATPPEVVLLRPKPGHVYVGAEEVVAAPALPGDAAPDEPAVILTLAGLLDGLGAPVFPVEAHAEDPGAASGVAEVRFLLDGAVTATDASAPYTWAWPTTEAADGAHHLVAVARDAAGNTAHAEVQVLLGAPDA